MTGGPEPIGAPAPATAPVVMIVSFAEVFGGAERSMLTLARHLPDQGWTPVVVCPTGPVADAAAALGIRVVPLRLRRTRTVGRHEGDRKRYSPRAAVAFALALVGNARQVARAARAIEPVLISSNSLSSHPAVALAGRLSARPVLWHLREITTAGGGRRVLRALGRLTSGTVAISAASAAVVPHARAVTIANPVEEPPAQVPRPPWRFPRPVVGYLGRLDPRKGIEDLIVAAGSTGAHVIVAGRAWSGTEEYVASLHALAESRAPGRVHFVGAVDGPWQALAAMDVLVVPSWAEPWGRVAAEGQRAGVPVLAADAGGLPDIVRDGHDGLLFPPRDPAALGDLLRTVLGDGTLRARLAAAGRVSAARYDPARHAAAMADVFRHHSSRRRRATGTGRPGAERSSW